MACNINDRPTDLRGNDFSMASRIKGTLIHDANFVLGTGTYAYALDASSPNIPNNLSSYVISNTVNVDDGSLIQFAMPTDASQGVMAYRTYSNEEFSDWVILNYSAPDYDGEYAKIDGSNINPTTWNNLTAGNSMLWNGQKFLNTLMSSNPGQLLAYNASTNTWQPVSKTVLKNWLDIVAPDFTGLLTNPTYDSQTHVFTMDIIGGGVFKIDLPIEQLIEGVELVGDDLIFTFEDGSEVTIPLNTLLVGVVKSVNGKTPNSQGNVAIDIADIPGLSDALDGKANVGGNNLSNISTWQSNLKIITANTTQTGLSGNKTTSGTWTFGQVRKAGQNDTQILLAGGGHKPISDFALASEIITPNDGLLTISTSSDLTGGGTFSADQSTASNINIGLSQSTIASLSLADSALQSGDNISELNNDVGYVTNADLPVVGNGNITYSGVGDVVGGGTSTANQTGNTSYTFDLTPQTKSNIALGVVAHGWGNHADEGYATEAWVNQQIDNTLKKNESNTVTQDFEITNGSAKFKPGEYWAIEGEFEGVSTISLGSDDVFALNFSMNNGNYLEAYTGGIYGNNRGTHWSFNLGSGTSKMRMPETGNTNRVLTTGTKIGSTTYYANTQGIIELPVNLSNYLEKDTSNMVTQDFEITDGNFRKFRVGDYGVIRGEITGLLNVEVGTDDGFAVSYHIDNGENFEAHVSGISGKVGGENWGLVNATGVQSNMRMPETGSASRVLTLGAKLGSNTYYANTQGIVELPDYPDVSGFVPTARTITAGNGLSGGGNLTANRTITLGTPSSIGLTSTNSVTSTSHTHALDAATITAINQGVTAHGWGDFRDYGLGTIGMPEVTVLSNVTNTGFYRINNTNTSASGAPAHYGSLIHLSRAGTEKNEIFLDVVSDNMYFRRILGSTVGEWRRLYHTGNFNPAQYVLQTSLNTQLANYVPINGVTTINNTKTFTSSPIVPNATLNGHAVNLGQLNTILDDYATVAEFDNTLKKNESNTVTEDFEIANDYVTVKLNNYGAIHGKSNGLNEIQLGGDAGFAVRYSTSYGDSFDATPYEVQGIANGKYWTLKNDNEVVSIMRMPETGPTNRVLALGAKFGSTTYYANTKGIINIPGYTAGTGISIASNVITNTAPNATHTGDVTGSTTLTIANNAVTNPKMAKMNANSIKGRAGSIGNPQDLTPAQVRTMLNVQEGANRTRIGINGGNYTEVGDINLIAGSNISLSKSGNNVTINSSSSSVNTNVKAYLPGEVLNGDTIYCGVSKTIIYLSPTFTGPLNIAIEPELQDGAWLIVIHTYQGSGPGLFNINGSLIDITAQLTSTYQASQGKRYRFIYVKDLGRFALVDGGGIYQ